MKKYILLFILSLIAVNSFCGNFPFDKNGYPDYAKWNWEDVDKKNWVIKSNGRWVELNCPFIDQTDKSDLLKTIHRQGDYKYIDGWRLVHANFDGTYPYFILYNIKKSILRCFMFTGEQANYEAIGFTITPKDETNLTKNFLYATDKFVPVNEYYDTSQESINAYSTAGLNTWVVFELPILFDNTVSSKYANWIFQFNLCTTFKVNLETNGSSRPVDKYGNDLFTHPPLKNGKNELKPAYSKFNKNLKEASKWTSEIKKSGDDLKLTDKDPEFLHTFKNTASGLGSFSKVLNTVSKISSGVEVAVGFLDFLLGGSKTSSQPMVYGYSHQFSTTGEIIVERIVRRNELSLPGSKNADNPAWAYNNAMGILNLANTPSILKTNSYLALAGARRANSTSEGWDNTKSYATYYYISNNPNVGSSLQSMIYTFTYPYKRDNKNTYPFVSYYMEDKNEEWFNIKSDFEIVNVKAALIFKDTNKDNITKSRFSYGVTTRNLVYELLEKGVYTIHQYDEENNLYTYGTPYLDIKTLAQLPVIGFQEVDLFFSVIVTYKAKGDDELFYFKGIYKPKFTEKDQAKYVFFANEWMDKGGAFDPYNHWITTNSLELKTTSVSSFFAREIVLKPGFVGRPSFKAVAGYSKKGDGNGTGFRTNVFTYPSDNLGSTRPIVFRSAAVENEENEIIGMDEKIISEYEILLYPNPTEGLITFRYTDVEALADIHIYDYTTNRKVYSSAGISSGETIDLGGNPPGIYLVRIIVNRQVFTQKIILK